jgi:hypothetical protein
MKSHPLLGTLATLLLLAVPALARAQAGVVTPDTSKVSATSGDVGFYWRTRAERTHYRQTSDYDETMRYVRQLEAGSRWIKVDSYGKSGQGRDLPIVILSRDRAFTPEAARATGKPIVLIQNGIHSGEIEGKDACLALMRDIAVTHTRADLLDSAIVLVLPIFSVDAHERHGRYNRINQNGPEEMGWRTTPVGLNLNRDYLKAEAPEMRALLANVFTKWWPHLLVDNHTTDGADYRYDVTYGINHGAGVPPPVDRWMADALEGRIVPRCRELGHVIGPYMNFRGDDPRNGIDMGNAPPRFSNCYPTLQCRPALLVETHMLKPYGVRVKATYDLMVALLEELRAHPRDLVRAVEQAESEAVARGRESNPAKRAVVLDTRVTDKAVPFQYEGFVAERAMSDITGSIVPKWTTTPWDTIIPLYREIEPTLTVTQPVGYILPQEWSAARERLDLHGVRYRRFAKAWTDSVECTRIVEWKAETALREGHYPTRVTRIETFRVKRSIRPGDLWIPLDQRSAAVAVNLLEPQAPDGLTYWNFFDTVLMQKEYGEDYVVAPLARKMMADNPALKKEFETKLAADSAFAKNPFARVNFFYTRSLWADPEQNVLPVVRALRPPPETVLAP